MFTKNFIAFYADQKNANIKNRNGEKIDTLITKIFNIETAKILNLHYREY